MAHQVSGEGTTSTWSFSGKQPHLPPKSPLFPNVGSALPDSSNSLFSSWSNFPFPSGSRKQHKRIPSASFIPQTPPSWIDDLLSDTPEVSSKKSSHRRSSSDSMAYLEAPVSFAKIDDIAEEDEFDCSSVASIPSRGSQDFDRLDEEQLMSMFADVDAPQRQKTLPSEVSTQPISHLSTPSDSNSANEHSYEEKGKRGGKLQSEPEVQSARTGGHTLQPPGSGEFIPTSNLDPSLDPKRAKRVLANRQSAQRSRLRKLQYISELERSVNGLQAEVSTLSPQVAYLDHQRMVLNVDNSSLKQRIAALAQEKLFKDAHYEALKKELQRLRQLYQQQQLQQDLNFDFHQQHFSKLDLGEPLQVDAKPEAVVASILMKCPNTQSQEKESDDHSTSPMQKSVGPSNCVVGESGKGLEGQMMTGNVSAHADFMVQNP